MKKKLMTILLTLMATLSFAGVNISNIKLEDMKTNKIQTFKEISKGKKTYVKVWASWCSYCVRSMPDFETLSSKTNLDYEVISIVSPEHSGELSKQDFIQNWEFDYAEKYPKTKIYFVSSSDLEKILQVRAYPTNIYVDSKGEIQQKLSGITKNYKTNNIMKGLK